ncbi:hypothetical protein HEQ63_09535 [Haematospirillum jordaniae]|uniref:sensor histidine kinase n=1 Tax=Haematospirillum jordaniae TaxID=1549855 RepID=UPI001433232A|nr:ATP-binding protein [Haematospirillum jordaniae]NKD86423.1 hypothetical protein [Haematospirillum jordaniae]
MSPKFLFSGQSDPDHSVGSRILAGTVAVSHLQSASDQGLTMPEAHRSVSLSRCVRVALIGSVPPVAVLIGLVTLGRLPVGDALLSWLCIVVGLIILVRPFLADLAAVAACLRDDRLGEGSHHLPDLRFSETGRDIVQAAATLRSEIRQRLKQSKHMANLHGSLITNMPQPLMLVGQDQIVLTASPAAGTLFARDVVNRSLASVLRDPPVLEAVAGTLQSGVPRSLNLVVPSGPVERYFDLKIEPVPAPEGDRQAVLLFHDVTVLVRAEKMRADFVANASHELRTPLTGVIGFLETLNGPARDDSDARERFLGIMYQQALRMKRLIDDLMSLSQVELHEHAHPTEAVNLALVASDAVAALEPQAEERGISLVLDVPGSLPPVPGDADELSQVVQNLLTNAIRYGQDKKPVTIEIRVGGKPPPSMPRNGRDHCLSLTVRDHGVGIPREHIPRLTERFYRVDPVRSRQQGGTGLGLAIVKHIVNRHRGTLHIDSTPGQGSAFSVWLPYMEQHCRQTGKTD